MGLAGLVARHVCGVCAVGHAARLLRVHSYETVSCGAWGCERRRWYIVLLSIARAYLCCLDRLRGFTGLNRWLRDFWLVLCIACLRYQEMGRSPHGVCFEVILAGVHGMHIW